MSKKENWTDINFNKLERAEDLLACFAILAIDGPGAKMTPDRIGSVRDTLIAECCGDIKFTIKRGIDGCPPIIGERPGDDEFQSCNSMVIKLVSGGYVSYQTHTEEEAHQCKG